MLSSTPDIRLGFCNVNGLVNKTHGVTEFFKRKKLSVMFLVETWLKPGQRVPIPDRLQFHNVCLSADEMALCVGGRSGREGIMILARPEARSFIKVLHSSGSKRWVLCKVDEYFVVCGYFAPSTDNSEIMDMLTYVCERDDVDLDRTMFIGDFNARLGGMTSDKTTNTRGTWFKEKVLKDFGLSICKPVEGKWTTVTASGTGVTDLLLCSLDSTCNVSDLRVHEKYDVGGSDHRPLSWSVHRHRTYELPTIERWNLSRMKQPYYSAKLSEALHGSFFHAFESMINLFNRVDGEGADVTRIVNEMNDVFTQWLSQACSVSIGKAYFDVGEVCKKFNNDRVEHARQAVKRQCAVLTEVPTLSSRDKYSAAYSEYKTARNYYKEVCGERRNELFEEHVEELALSGNRVMFQKHVSRLKKRALYTSNQLDPECMPEYAKHFENTFGARPTGARTGGPRERVLNVDSCVIDLRTESIEKELGKFKLGKAAGPDEVFTEVIKHESNLACQLLSLLFKVCYTHAVVPDVWCTANVCLVFKNKGNVMDVANYRPISLTCVVRRLYERMLLLYMVPFTETVLHECQGGFRPNRSTLHQCYALHEIMQAHPKALHAFLDLKAAYDTVNRTKLWKDMEGLGVNAHMISVCMSLFDHNVSNLVVNGAKSGDIRCKRGLLQGSSLSPLLFNIYINSLLVKLDRLPKVLTEGFLSNSLFFADDGALHAKTALALQCLLNVCSEWGDEYGMTFASGKCVVVCPEEYEEEYIFTIQGGAIPFEPTFVYLGVECSVKGMMFQEKHKDRCAKMKAAAQFFKSKGMNVFGWRVNSRVAVYKSFLRPMIEYGCPLMRANDPIVDVMERSQNMVLNTVLSCARSTSTGAKLKLLQVEPMGIRREKLQYRFFSGLDVNVSSAPAAVMWRNRLDSDGSRCARLTKMQNIAITNPIYEYAATHDVKDTGTFMRKRKFEAMKMYDKTDNNGKLDIAASIRCPERHGLSAYTDPSMDKQDQHDVISLRTGAFAFHQECKLCGEATTREHAARCSGEDSRLQRVFPLQFESYSQRYDPAVVLFQDYLLNEMDVFFSRRHGGDRAKAIEIFSEMATCARNIRSSVSGYVQSVDGKAWYHPLKSKRKFSYVYHRQDQSVTVRRARIRLAHPPRPVGRPRKAAASQSTLASEAFDPP